MADTKELKPVAWQRRLSGPSVRATAKEWHVISDEQRKQLEKDGHPHGLPDVTAEIRPLYSADAIERLERERDEARGIVRDIHWMAVRYADNRKSYAVGMCNDALRKAYDGGWLVFSESKQHDIDPQYARHGLLDAEWRSAVDDATARATAAEAEAATLRARVAKMEEALRRELNILEIDVKPVVKTSKRDWIKRRIDYLRAALTEEQP